MTTRLFFVPFSFLFVALFPAASRGDDAEAAKLRDENRLLQAKLAERDRTLLELTRQVEDLRRQLTAAKLTEKTVQDRMIALEVRVRQLEKELAGKGAPPIRPVPPGKGNFPEVRIEGLVSKTDAKSGLMTLSVGSDAGLEKGHSLHVFRLDPKPEKSLYLGVIDILAVTPRESVARLRIKLPAGKTIEVGDRVASVLGDK